MTRPAARGGVAGTFFLLCAACLIGGLAFDFGLQKTTGFWLAAQPGAGAAIGAGAAAFVVAAALVGRILLGRRVAEAEPKGGRVGGHS